MVSQGTGIVGQTGWPAKAVGLGKAAARLGMVGLVTVAMMAPARADWTAPVLAQPNSRESKEPVSLPEVPNPRESAAPRPATVDGSGRPDPTPNASAPLRFTTTVPEVTVLEAGRGDLLPLRFRPQVGQSQTVQVTMKVAAQVKLEGESVPPMPIPDTQLTLSSALESIDPNKGEWRSQVTYDQIQVISAGTVQPELAQAMQQALASINGLRVAMTGDDRGGVSEIEVFLPAEAGALRPVLEQFSEQFTQSMGQMSVVFPQEAVGVGGRWQVKGSMQAGGIRLEQTIIYTLEEIRDDRLLISTTIAQIAPPQIVESAGIPNFELKRLETVGTGQMEILRDRLLPDRARLNLQSSSELSAPGLGALVSDTQIDMTLDPAQ